ncbi:Phage head-tail joining protein [Sphingobium sp. AP50]|uniref:phage head completion protein n=1 Tax=Sphingobium sp. AP50 TaxID=1884369 RepID=UPI0008BF8F48|nr:head-tail adaptor protein [Sphingobium sp. AP50]SEI68331.1 Phage head-tail joining protein [Sphingobium sp. AP50]
MGDPRLTAKARDKRILIETETGGSDGFGHKPINTEWNAVANPWANIAYGSGSEQREAAQIGGSQTASFAVLNSGETKTVSVRDRIRYPLSDPDPAKWPAWEISAVAELGFNEGFAFTATRVAA